MIVKKYRFKPLYKKFLILRENVHNKQKLLNFKKKKWKKLIRHYKNRLKKYRKFKPKDQNRYFVTKYPNKGTAYKKLYRDTLYENKKFGLFYGGLNKKILKKRTKTILTKTKNYTNLNMLLMENFENRLDVILYQSKFSPTVKTARQLIIHGKVLVNNKIVKNKSYILKTGDLVKIDPKDYRIIKRNIQKIEIWPPKNKPKIKKIRSIRKFKNKLDILLYQLKLSYNLKTARQLIIHGKVLVNNKIIKNKSYILRTGDIIKVNPKFWLPKKTGIWPIPPKHLIINYKTMQIIVGTIKDTNTSINFPFYINLERILKNRYKY
jgi:ribosomal protein S4